MTFDEEMYKTFPIGTTRTSKDLVEYLIWVYPQYNFDRLRHKVIQRLKTDTKYGIVRVRELRPGKATIWERVK